MSSVRPVHVALYRRPFLLARHRLMAELPRLAALALPLFAYGAVTHLSERRIGSAIGAGVALLVFILFARAPGFVLVAIVPWTIVQFSFLAWLYHLGVPGVIVHPLSGLRDLALAALIFSAMRRTRQEGDRLDGLDKLALAYIAVLGLYLMLPGLMAGATAPRLWNVRFLAFRADAYFVAVLVAARHVELSSRRKAQVLVAVAVAGALAAGVGIYEWFRPTDWNHFAVHTLGVQRYQVQVLGNPVADPLYIGHLGPVGNRQISRPGSLLYEPVLAGLYMLVGFATALAMAIRSRGAGLTYPLVGLMGMGVLLTLTRAAQLGLVVALVAAVVAARGRAEWHDWRQHHQGTIRLVLAMAAILVILGPIAASTGAFVRLGGHADNGSSTGHEQSFQGGLALVVKQPLGHGLGTTAGIGQRFEATTQYTSHNSYLQIGHEVGVPAMLLFAVITISLLRALKRVAGAESVAAALGLAAFAGGTALAIAGLFQHVWVTPEIAWAYWALAGVALNRTAEEAEKTGYETPTVLGPPNFVGIR